jgi:hypothetical protein
MLTLSKKYQIIVSSFLVGFIGIFFFVASARALSSGTTQVKIAGSPAVYYLDWKNQVKKTYINAAAYLSYSHKWSDIKTVSSTDLKSWPEAKLFRLAEAPAIYYIQENKKVLVQGPADLGRYDLVGEPVLNVSAEDLAQYQLVDYAAVGWNETDGNSGNNGNTGNDNGSNNQSSTGGLTVYNDLVNGANGNTLVPNTTNNLLGVFRFVPSAAATIGSVAFNLTGVYSTDIIDSVAADNASDADYGANVNWRSSDHKVIVNFRPALDLAAGQTATVKILANLENCPNCNGENLHLELPNAAAVSSTLPVIVSPAVWPLEGTQFKIVSVNNVIGQLQIQSQAIASSTAGTGAGTRLISQLALKETSKNEDVLVQKLTFSNSGSASVNDWNNFTLLQDGQVVARTTNLDNNGQIVFNINYLRVPAGGKADLTVTAGLLSTYNPQATYNVQPVSAQAVGATYNLSLSPVISNQGNSLTLN